MLGGPDDYTLCEESYGNLRRWQFYEWWPINAKTKRGLVDCGIDPLMLEVDWPRIFLFLVPDSTMEALESMVYFIRDVETQELLLMVDSGEAATSRGPASTGVIELDEQFWRDVKREAGEPGKLPPFSQGMMRRHALRFKFGDRVSFKTGQREEDQKKGVVVCTWYREEAWLPGCMPYQLRTDDGSLVYAYGDTDGDVTLLPRKQTQNYRDYLLNDKKRLVLGGCEHAALGPTGQRGGLLACCDHAVCEMLAMWLEKEVAIPQANGISFKVQATPVLRARLLQWDALDYSVRRAVWSAAREIGDSKTRDLFKVRGTTHDVIDHLVPERVDDPLDAARLLELIDESARCGMCAQLPASLPATARILVDGRCPCPNIEKCDQKRFIVDRRGRRICVETRRPFKDEDTWCFEQLWQLFRRHALADFLYALSLLLPVALNSNVPREAVAQIVGYKDKLQKKLPPDMTHATCDDFVGAQPKADANCANCGKDASDCTLLRCGRCRKLYFCSQVCQLSAWPAHRKQCKKVPPT